MDDRTDSRRPYGAARVSPQRRTIADVTASLGGAFTVEALADAVREADAGIGTATVYRAVGALVASGWLERVGEREGSALFVRCAAGGHHHHLVCDGCGAVSATPCTVPHAEDSGGFVVTRHEVTLYGLCPACRTGGEG